MSDKCKIAERDEEPIVISGKTAEEVCKNFEKKSKDMGLKLKKVKRT